MRRILKTNKFLSIINRNLYDSLINSNIGYIYNIGILLGISMTIQIVSGIILSMYYIGKIDEGFSSVEYIMREVTLGSTLRYVLSNGVSLIFVMLYLLIFKSLYYGSYIKPRGQLYVTGVVLLLLLIVVSFLGYSLVCGIQSYWAIVVITNLLSSIPYIGVDLVILIWSSYSPSSLTIRRFYSLLYILGILVLGLIIALIIALLELNGTTSIGVTGSSSLINFLSYLTIKDIYPIICYIGILGWIVTVYPYRLEDVENNIEFNSLVTPLAIVPLWYLLPYYTILRCIENKLLGVIMMLLSILVLTSLIWSNTSLLRCNRFRIVLSEVLQWFVVIFILLMILGSRPASEPYISIGRVCSFLYFSYILYISSLVSIIDNTFIYYQRKV